MIGNSITTRVRSIIRIITQIIIAVISVGLFAVALIHLEPVRDPLLGAALRYLSSQLGCTLSVESTSLNLPTGRLSLKQVAMESLEPKIEKPALTAAYITVDLDMTALILGSLALEKITIESPRGQFFLDETGTLHTPFAPPSATQTTTSQPKPTTGILELPDLKLKEFSLRDGSFSLESSQPQIPSVAIQDMTIRMNLDLAPQISDGTLNITEIEVRKGQTEERFKPWQVAWHLPGDSPGNLNLTVDLAGVAIDLKGTILGVYPGLRYDTQISLEGELDRLLHFISPSCKGGGGLNTEIQVAGDLKNFPNLILNLKGADLHYGDWLVPELQVNAHTDSDRFTIDNLTMETANGSVRIRGDGELKPKLGNIRIDGRVADLRLQELLAPLNLPVKIAGICNAEVLAESRLLDLASTSGKVSLQLLEPPPVAGEFLTPQIDVDAGWNGSILEVRKLTVKEASANLFLNGTFQPTSGEYSGALKLNAPDLKDLLSRAGLDGRGAVDIQFTGAGKISNPNLTGTILANDLMIQGAEVALSSLAVAMEDGRIELNAEEFKAKGFSASLEGKGILPISLEEAPIDLELNVLDVAYNSSPIDSFQIKATIAEDISAVLQTSSQTLNVEVMVPKQQPKTVRVELTAFNPAVVQPFLPATAPKLGGSLSCLFAINLPQGDLPPMMEGSISEFKLLANDHSVNSIEPIDIDMRDQIITVRNCDLRSNDNSRLVIEGSVNLAESDINASVRAECPQIQAWADIIGDKTAQGTVAIDLMVQGSPALPEPIGALLVSDLKFGDLSAGRISMSFEKASHLDSVLAGLEVESLVWQGKALPPITLSAGLRGTDLTVTSRLFEGSLAIDSQIHLGNPQTYRANLQFQDFDLGIIESFVESPLALRGDLTGEITANGDLAKPVNSQASVLITGLNIVTDELRLSASEPLAIVFQDGSAIFRSFALEGENLELNVTGALPIFDTIQSESVTADPGVPNSQPTPEMNKSDRNASTQNHPGTHPTLLECRTRINLPVLLPFTEALDKAQGTVTAHLTMEGAASEPKIRGNIVITDGLIDGPEFPAAFRKINGAIEVNPNEVIIDSIKAGFAGGTIETAGYIKLQDLKPTDVDIRVRARDLEVTYGDEIEVGTSADLGVTGIYPRLKAGGEVRIKEALYTPAVDILGILNALVDKGSPNEEGGEPEEGEALSIALDLAVLAPGAIRVENPNLELTLGAKLQIIGSSTIPGVLGTVTILDGMIDLFRAQFTVTSGLLTFSDPWSLNPGIEITAVTEKKNEEITLRIEGTAKKPNLILSSLSGKSQSEIIKILVGVPPDSGPKTSLGDMAKDYATRSMAGALADQIGVRTGLEIIPFPPSSEGEEFMFSAKKQIGESISVTYYKGMKTEQGDSVEIEYELNSNTRLRARQNQDSSISGGIRFRKTFD